MDIELQPECHQYHLVQPIARNIPRGSHTSTCLLNLFLNVSSEGKFNITICNLLPSYPPLLSSGQKLKTGVFQCHDKKRRPSQDLAVRHLNHFRDLGFNTPTIPEIVYFLPRLLVTGLLHSLVDHQQWHQWLS